MKTLIEPYTPEMVQDFVRHHFEDCPMLIVSNREPYIHTMRGDTIQCKKSVGGLTAALDPIMQTVGGTWVAHGSGDADAEAANRSGQVAIPPEAPTYTSLAGKAARSFAVPVKSGRKRAISSTTKSQNSRTRCLLFRSACITR